MAKGGINRSISIPQPSIFGRIGTGIGKGLGEALPEEIERGRLTSGLNELSQQKGLDPFQQFAGLVATGAYKHPQILQSATDLLRQKAIIDNINQRNQGNQPPPPPPAPAGMENNQENPTSVTTKQGTYSKLNPHIPPNGQQQEYLARKRFSEEPLVYPTLEAARASVANEIAGNTNKSNAEIQAEELKEKVQEKAEAEMAKTINTFGANIPARVMIPLQQQALKDVKENKLTPEQAGLKYGQEADEISESFSNIKSLGDISLITKKSDAILNSLEEARKRLKKIQGGINAGIDTLIGENDISPNLAGALLEPIKENKNVNNFIKSIPEIHPKINKSSSGPGLAGLGRSNPNPIEETLKIAPKLAEIMGDANPLSIGYELDKKGYDSDTWKRYLIDNQELLNLKPSQTKYLLKGPKSYFSGLNDWFLRSFSGIE